MFARKCKPYVADVPSVFPEFKGSNRAIWGEGTSRSLSAPSVRAAGDLLVGIVSAKYQSIASYNSSDGWAQSFVNIGGPRLSCFWKIADNSSADTLTITVSLAAEMLICILCVSGANATAPISHDTISDSSASLDPPEHSPAAGSDKYLWIACAVNATLNQHSDGPSGFTQIEQNYGDSEIRFSVAYRLLEAASVNPGAWTISTARQYGAAKIAVHPE
jgi:hypothetical protein